MCTLVACVHRWSVYIGGVNYFVLFNSLYLLSASAKDHVSLLDNIRKHLKCTSTVTDLQHKFQWPMATTCTLHFAHAQKKQGHNRQGTRKN